MVILSQHKANLQLPRSIVLKLYWEVAKPQSTLYATFNPGHPGLLARQFVHGLTYYVHEAGGFVRLGLGWPRETCYVSLNIIDNP